MNKYSKKTNSLSIWLTYLITVTLWVGPSCADSELSENTNHQKLIEQASQFLQSVDQDVLNSQSLDDLEKESQQQIKKLQRCEKNAEQEINQLAEIRKIEALRSDAQDSQQQANNMLPQSAATQEVDRQINSTTRRLISCRLKTGLLEEARLAILEKRQQLWVNELTSKQDVWSFIHTDKDLMEFQKLREIIPINLWFLMTVLLGLLYYFLVWFRNRRHLLIDGSLTVAEFELKSTFGLLLKLFVIPLILAITYYLMVQDNKIHALVLFLGLMLRDACVLLPIKLNASDKHKPFVKPFIWYSTALIAMLAVGWNSIHFKQQVGASWLTDYSLIMTPMIILIAILLVITNRYFCQLITPHKDRFVPLLIAVVAFICLVAYIFKYAQGAQYLMIITVAVMLVHWLLKVINTLRKVMLVDKINQLKQQDDYDGSNFAFPFWISLVTVVTSMLIGMVFIAWLAGVSGEAYKQVSFIYSEGFELGSVRIVPEDILIALLLVAVMVWFIKKLKVGIEDRWFDKSRVKKSSREVLSMLVWYAGLTIAIFVGLSIAGFDISNLAIIAGALSVGIGFGLKNIVSNFVSGLILLFERPVTRGDWVEVGDTVGLIEKVKIRATRIRTFDNAEILVPNSELLSHHVTNWTLSNSIGRITVKVGVAYGSDINQVREILDEIARQHDEVMQRDPYRHKVLFREFGDSSLNFELRVMIKDIKKFLDVETDLNFAIDEALRGADISIPFPQRDLHIKDSSVLHLDDAHNDDTQKSSQNTNKTKPDSEQKKPETSNDSASDEDKGEVEQLIEEDEKRKEKEKLEEIKAKQESAEPDGK